MSPQANELDSLGGKEDFDSLCQKTLKSSKKGRWPWLSLQANGLDSLGGKEDCDSLWKDNCKDFESPER